MYKPDPLTLGSEYAKSTKTIHAMAATTDNRSKPAPAFRRNTSAGSMAGLVAAAATRATTTAIIKTNTSSPLIE